MTLVFALTSILAAAAPRQSRAQDDAALGTGVTALCYWSTELPLMDGFKTSAPWVSGTEDEWDDHAALDLDERGWVRSLRPGQVARTLLFWGIGSRYPAGRYVVEYDGEGTMEYRGAATLVERAPGRDVLHVDAPQQEGIGLDICATNPVNYLRNIRVRMPVRAPAGEVFNPRFLERLQNYRVIRFCGWMIGNDLTAIEQRTWSDRPRMDDARWSVKGAPLELMVALANRLGADPWFNIPHLADDDYVRQFAREVARTLAPGRKAYVEHSNEVWNNLFSQADEARRRGLALNLSPDPYEAQIRYHALRSRQIFGIFEEELGRDRLVRVLASQSGGTYVSETLLSFGDTRAHTDVLAVGSYFGYEFGAVPELAARVEGMDLDQFMQVLADEALPQTRSETQQQIELARRFGVPLVAYEGGQHLVGFDGLEQHPALNDLFDAANRDPRMGALYTRLLREWRAAGGQLFLHLENCEGYDRNGRWGALEYIDQPRAEAPKFDALQRFMEEIGQVRSPAPAPRCPIRRRKDRSVRVR